jgi:diacylglycerol kinase
MAHRVSFRHAIDGLIYVCKTQPNMRIHGAIALAVLGAGWYFSLSRGEWLILLFTIMLVFVAEMVNTSVEAMTDLITKEYKQEAKIAKDVSAGMVLLTTLVSVVVGLVVFGPYLLG